MPRNALYVVYRPAIERAGFVIEAGSRRARGDFRRFIARPA
jgi:hypothetical protein